jgi:hypothetical protein
LYISTKNTVWIVDFNVFGEPTETKLFETWEEIENLKEFEFRIVDNKIAKIQPNLSMYSRLPYDLLDVQNEEKMKDLYEQYKEMNEKEK